MLQHWSCSYPRTPSKSGDTPEAYWAEKAELARKLIAHYEQDHAECSANLELVLSPEGRSSHAVQHRLDGGAVEDEQKAYDDDVRLRRLLCDGLAKAGLEKSKADLVEAQSKLREATRK